MPTLQQKYDYLCAWFRVHSVDAAEQDAFLSPIKAFGVVFQFPNDALPLTVDKAVTLCIQQGIN